MGHIDWVLFKCGQYKDGGAITFEWCIIEGPCRDGGVEASE